MKYFPQILCLFFSFLVHLTSGTSLRANRPFRPSRLIINGKPTKPGEFPWMVRITMKGMAPLLQCGGALIGSNVVLSASHCVVKFGLNEEKYINSPSMYEVVVGDWDIVTMEPIERHIAVKHIVHNSFEWATIKNDISMLILEEHVPCARNLRPINLPLADKTVSIVSGTSIPIKNLTDAECYLSGWGMTENNTFATELRSLKYPGLIDPETCQTLWNKSGGSPLPVIPGMLCTKADYDASACHGDSGGPLVCKYNNEWRLFGLTSWGDPGCGAPDLDVFTDVGYFTDWIYETLATYPEAARGVWQSYMDCAALDNLDVFGKMVKECTENYKVLDSLGLFCAF